MSTNGCIMRADPNGGPATGRYHHWDSYPSGLGKTLWNLYHGLESGSERFRGNLPLILTTLVDDHKGWSTINGADWSQDPGYIEHEPMICRQCGSDPFSAYHLPPLGHTYVPLSEASRPKCYCHGDRSEDDGLRSEADPVSLAGLFCYVLGESQNGNPMRYMRIFWAGYPERFPATHIAIINLDGPEPQWDALDQI